MIKRIVSTTAAAMMALTLSAGHVAAENYRPGFACPRPDNSDALLVAICSNPMMAKAELTLEKTYYAHRELDGSPAFPDLKARAAKIDKATRDACHITTQGLLPADVADCYSTQTFKAAKEWASSIFGPGYEEAGRDIDTHIAAQRKLASQGLLDPAKVDGIYGDDTRDAIIAWQRAKSVMATGFLSDLQVRQLLASNDPTLPASVGTGQAEKLQAVFTAAMLNVRVAYLEAAIGPAVRVMPIKPNREARLYRIAGCSVTAYTADTTVYGYGIDVSRACRPDLSDMLSGLPQQSWPQTFGAFADRFDQVQATCLGSCGNASDPIIISKYQGSHAEGYMTVELWTGLASDKALTASSAWQAAMKSRGDDYVVSGRFNCDQAFQPIAKKAFADVLVTHVFVGYGQDEIADDIDRTCASLQNARPRR